MSKLIIVESPTKTKTIKEYLGKDYTVVASMGHVRDLPAAKLNVDVKNNFEPKYAIIKGKENLVRDLQKEVAKADEVYLATDPDREGEAISWHLATLLGLDMNKANRVTFNEITKTGIMSGIKNPHKIDMDLVNAQQARRILDRLVGYRLRSYRRKSAAVSPPDAYSLSPSALLSTARRRSAPSYRRSTGHSTRNSFPMAHVRLFPPFSRVTKPAR